MEVTNLKYEQTYSLVKRMRNKHLVQDLGLVRVGAANAKKYGLLISPEQFLKEEREQNPAPLPPAGFFNNPFNLKNAKDLRYENV